MTHSSKITNTQEQFIFATRGRNDASRKQPVCYSSPRGLQGSTARLWTINSPRPGHGVHGERNTSLSTGYLHAYLTTYSPINNFIYSFLFLNSLFFFFILAMSAFVSRSVSLVQTATFEWITM